MTYTMPISAAAAMAPSTALGVHAARVLCTTAQQWGLGKLPHSALATAACPTARRAALGSRKACGPAPQAA